MNLDLFPPTDKRPHEVRRREEMHDLARSDEVMSAALEAIPSDRFVWLDHKPLSQVKRHFHLGFYFRDTLFALEREGLIESRQVYHGAPSPVTAEAPAGCGRTAKDLLPEYLGYRVEFRRLA